MSIMIKELPLEERPRERLLKYGANVLSNEELLSLIIKSGSSNNSVKDIAVNVLKKYNCIQDLSKINYEELIKIKGIGNSIACTIIASIELGNRINQKVSNLNGKQFNHAKIIFDYYQVILNSKLQEHFYCIYLDIKKRFIKEKLLFVGTLNYSLVHPREIFKEAYLIGAAFIVCVHNHPSGELTPSIEDKDLTQRLQKIGILFGIPILDHIIISKDKYFSFYENNIL